MTNVLKDLELIWNKVVTMNLYNPFVAKMAMPLNSELSGRGIGQTTYKGIAYASGYGGRTSFSLEMDYEVPELTQVNYSVPKQFSSRVMRRDIYESFLLDGIPIGTDLAIQMMNEIQQQQNATVLIGWTPDGTNYAVLGMYNVANNTYGASGSFGTYGNALKAVSNAIGLLNADNIYSDDGYNMFLNPVEKTKILASHSTVGTPEYGQVIDLLNVDVASGGKPGKIISSPNITAGTGMICPTATPGNRKYFELIEPQVPYNNLWYVDGNSKDGDIRCRQVASLFPTFKHLSESVANKDDCICTLTSIA